MNIANCPRCGKIFSKNFRDVCPSCIKEIDQEYALCADHLRQNKGITTQELSEATGVSVRQISKFIREGRISIIGSPNLGYPCEVCSTMIREGNMCMDCRGRLVKDVDRISEQMKAEMQNKSNQGVYRTKS
ncbi:flagellar operon protein (TIGR03826 family) [Paenibacillus phyllosphaerae]|uniref:Flagellar operon protein (TIGR03826 family) n=1 Tax=Paenibacillus phyllosphaerae TaxID=274593 RepID=A0A7W5AXW9_9BACL|nr:TIGR03826 family flagellar region protein [Paenibacillus phyllosphaerae]MBB3110499.1 flagellar operon protein (TIGR03826 family) [Paenibacillus phyllosphaerae]